MGQTNDTPAERRIPAKPPARRSPVPPSSAAMPRDSQPGRGAASEHSGAGDTSRLTPGARANRPIAAGVRPRDPVSPLPPRPPEDDRILVFSTQRELPGRDQQPSAPAEPPAATDHAEPKAPTSLPRRRAIPISPRDDAGEGSAGGMVSLGDSLRDFVAVLEERRRRRLAEGRDGSEPVVLRSDLDEVCPLCGGAGYLRRDVPVGHPLFGQPVPCECKERELEERRHLEEEARLKQLDRFFSLSPFGDKTFETFHPNVRGTEAAYEMARQYAADPSGWLVLIGPPGTGKTHLAAAVAHERLAAGSSVYFAVVPELLDHLRAAFAPTSELTYDEMFDTVRSVEMLVLDDLGAQNSTPWAADKLFQIINFRYNYRLPTVITTNHKLHAQLDERVRSRLSDISLVRVVEFKNLDHRPRNTRITRR